MIKAILTGHSRGLGAALAEALLSRGIATLALARHGHAALAEQFPEMLREVRIDLADVNELRAWLDNSTLQDWLVDAEGALLINNAGVIGPVGWLDAQAPAPLARAVALNVTAPLLLSAAFTAATVGMRGRSIVHISSGAARRPIAGWSVYCACKAALDQHARVVAADAVPGLRICSLAPGVVDTDMQTEIRSSDPTHFPLHSQFATLHADGALVKATTAAARLLDYVLGADFGTHPVADLRDIV